MVAQKGRDLLLKVDQGGGSFVAVAGLRTRQITLNARTVDVTNADSTEGWRELLDGAGLRSAALSGSGVFRDAAADATVRALFFAGTIRTWQLVVPDFGTIAGPFQISALDYAGDHDAELTYSLALESAGALTFTAAP